MRLLDVKEIAKKTSELIHSAQGDWPQIEALDRNHCLRLLDKVIYGLVYGEQAHRLIGWVQAACTFAGVGTMEEFRIINRGCPKRLQTDSAKETLAQILELEAIGKFAFFATDRKNAERINEQCQSAIRTIDTLSAQLADAENIILELQGGR